MKPLLCIYCGQTTERVGGDIIYPHRPDLYKLSFYRCVPCGAYVGCHKDTTTPMGDVATRELRNIRQKTHAAFDQIHANGFKTRKESYAWLSDQLDMTSSDCHIGKFTIEQCRDAIEVVDQYLALAYL